ncbi:MAG: HPr family phosphocarrier protein [Clostridiaceae bacterium]|nr:HPr family phosphocarrier protein [Clostridiaceae bacterium]
MVRKTVKVINPTGLHARPASGLIALVKTFKSNVTLEKGEKKANGKSIIQVLSLCCTQGSSVTVCAEGEDEVEALGAIEKYIENLSE